MFVKCFALTLSDKFFYYHGQSFDCFWQLTKKVVVDFFFGKGRLFDVD